MPKIWKPQCALETLKQRAFLMAKIRDYFNANNVLEVETPILSSTGNTDVNIESFKADRINLEFPNSYLRTSPEFPLKRLLCFGTGDVFEIGKVFRKGEISKTHNIEFTMLEWYRLDFDYLQLIQDVTKLFNFVFLCFDRLLQPPKIMSFSDCFTHYLTIDIATVSDKELNDICNENGYSGSHLSKDEAFDYLFATQIQVKMDKDCLTFVTLYPASQAALAKINPDDDTTSLRFEVFYQGYELGNGYQELTDGDELLQRFYADNEFRSKSNQIQIDMHLIDAMKNGLPECSGIAIGIDRLLMVLLDKEQINEVMTFTAQNA